MDDKRGCTLAREATIKRAVFPHPMGVSIRCPNDQVTVRSNHGGKDTDKVDSDHLGQAVSKHSRLAAAQNQRAEVFYDRLQQFAADQDCKPASMRNLTQITNDRGPVAFS